MATWQEFVDFAGNNFPIFVEDESSIRIDFAWNDGRSHWVRAGLMTLDPPMVWLVSPICEVDDADEAKVLQAQRSLSCVMGVVLFDSGYALSHLMGLDSLDGDEALREIRMIAELADELEKEVMGGLDEYTAHIAGSDGSPQGEAGFCIQCGAARVAGAAFCANCGARLT
jgi:hypothetical protein